MFDLFLSFLTGVGALVSGLLVITTLFLIFRKLKKRRIPKGVVLTLDLDQGVVEVPPTLETPHLERAVLLLQLAAQVVLALQQDRDGVAVRLERRRAARRDERCERAALQLVLLLDGLLCLWQRACCEQPRFRLTPGLQLRPRGAAHSD